MSDFIAATALTLGGIGWITWHTITGIRRAWVRVAADIDYVTRLRADEETRWDHAALDELGADRLMYAVEQAREDFE